MDYRNIIHLDLDAFYCAVEEQLNPELRGKPFAVGGQPNQRGVVASCSYAARAYGVRSAMPMARAKQLCPTLITISWTKGEYGKRSKEVMKILKRFTPLIEQISIDEAFLDIDAIHQDFLQIIKSIQDTINQETGLPCSLGGASNKLVAKIATDVGKSAIKTNTYPNAIQIVPFGKEAEFLAPLPARMLWGIGPKTNETLEQLGLYTIGAIASWPEKDLVNRFGQTGYEIASHARGIDNSPVTNQRMIKSISQENTFNEDIEDEKKLISELKKQCERVANNLEQEGIKGTTIKIKMRWPHFETLTRQITLPEATSDLEIIFSTATKLFKENWKQGIPLRLLGVGISGFRHPVQQLGLWDDNSQQIDKNLQSAIDELQKKFGNEIIHRGGKGYIPE